MFDLDKWPILFYHNATEAELRFHAEMQLWMFFKLYNKQSVVEFVKDFAKDHDTDFENLDIEELSTEEIWSIISTESRREEAPKVEAYGRWCANTKEKLIQFLINRHKSLFPQIKET